MKGQMITLVFEVIRSCPTSHEVFREAFESKADADEYMSKHPVFGRYRTISAVVQ